MSIQQSLNALIGATAGFATTGAFMYGQSTRGKTASNIREARRLGKEIDKLEAKKDLSPDEAEGLKVARTRYNELVGSAYSRSPAKASASGLSFTPNTEELAKTKERFHGIQGASATATKTKAARITAEGTALNRLEENMAAQREQKQALSARGFALLEEAKEGGLISAKQERQVADAFHKMKKKEGGTT